MGVGVDLTDGLKQLLSKFIFDYKQKERVSILLFKKMLQSELLKICLKRVINHNAEKFKTFIWKDVLVNCCIIYKKILIYS